MNRIGKCFSRPIKHDYLYVDNIKDNIDAILSFFKEQSGRDYIVALEDKFEAYYPQVFFNKFDIYD